MQRRVACIQFRRIVVARRYDEVGQDVKTPHSRQLTGAGVTNGQAFDTKPGEPCGVCFKDSFAPRSTRGDPVLTNWS